MPSNPKPQKREQIATDLRNAIHAGQLKPGERVPSMGDLQERYGCTIATVQAAMQILRREGLVEGGSQGRRARVIGRRPVIGRSAAYVTPDGDGQRQTWKGQMAELGMVGTQTLDRVGETAAPEFVAHLLGVEPGTPVLIRPRTMYADDVPVQLADTYYPLDLASGTELAQQKLVPAGLLYQLLEEAGLEVERCEEELTFPLSTEDEQRALNLSSNDRVVRMVRALYVTGPRVATVDVASLRQDRHRLTYSVPVHP